MLPVGHPKVPTGLESVYGSRFPVDELLNSVVLGKCFLFPRSLLQHRESWGTGGLRRGVRKNMAEH